MNLTELFNLRLPTSSSWDISDNTYAEFTFNVTTARGTIPYTIYAEKMDLDPEYGSSELSNYSFDLRMAGEIWGVEFGNNKVDDRYGVTHTGGAGEVFGYVAAALRLFKRSRPNAAFFFTAKEPSRKRLYDALVRRLGGSRQVQDSKFSSGLRGYLVM